MSEWLQRLNPFQYLKNRGKRIRHKDQHLLFSTFLFIFVSIYFGELTLVYYQKIQEFFRSTMPITERMNRTLESTDWIRFGVISFISILSCLVIIYLLYVSFPDKYRQLIHRQKIARMIIQNRWYEVETIQSEGFFKDLSSNRSKEKITYFPKVFYKMVNGYLIISVEISLNSYQDQLLHLEKKLESGLYCELVDKELEDSYVVYTMLYDTISNRISIDEVEAKDGSLRLMENVYWSYDDLPHMLIAGGTGGGSRTSS